jgi:hypothetical protein
VSACFNTWSIVFNGAIAVLANLAAGMASVDSFHSSVSRSKQQERQQAIWTACFFSGWKEAGRSRNATDVNEGGVQTFPWGDQGCACACACVYA